MVSSSRMARLPRVAAPKRLDSSHMKRICSRGSSLAKPSSCRLVITSRAQSVPTMPSKLPPPGTLSAWEPYSTAGASAEASVPSRRAMTLPKADGETGLFHFTYKIVTALPVIIGEGQTVEAVLLFADGGKGVQMLLKSFFAYHGRSPLMMLLYHIVGKNHSFDKKRLTLFSIMLQFMRDFLSQSVFQSK